MKDHPYFTSSVWSQAHDWPKKWASTLDANLCYPSVLLFQSLLAWLSYFMLSVRQRERTPEEGRLNAVQPPIGTVIITLSGGHKSSAPHLCQVSWHWLSNEGCLSLTMFTIDHRVTVSQQAERYECLLLHLNYTVLAHSQSSSDCLLISATMYSEHYLLNHSLWHTRVIMQTSVVFALTVYATFNNKVHLIIGLPKQLYHCTL